MKLPFDLGVKFFFRLVLPGFLITTGAWPIIFAALDALGWPSRHEAASVGVTMIGGWLLVLLDMPIYMLYEGRRWWPAWWRTRMLASEQQRIARLQHRIQQRASERDYVEASVTLREFPLDDEGRPVALFPTRLGNLITAFETYPTTRYGMDAVFYWPRLWISLGKETREDLDNGQALADSALYSSCALVIACVLWGCWGVAASVGYPIRGGLGPLVCLGSSVMAALGSGLLYRAALPVNAQFGEMFKAVFDAYGTRPAVLAKDVFDSSAVISLVTEQCGVAPETASSRDRFQIAWRYLHNYRIKCPTCGQSVPVPQCRAHVAQHSGTNPPG